MKITLVQGLMKSSCRKTSFKDIDKQNEMIEKVGGTRISGIELIKKSFEKAMSDTDKYLHVRA